MAGLGTSGDALMEFEDAGVPRAWLTITHPPFPPVTSRLHPPLPPLHLNTRAMDITSLFAAMQQHHQLATMPFLDLTTFLRCTSLLKDDILQSQPHTVSVLIAPDVLPPSVNEFLAERFAFSKDTVDVLWDIIKDLIWMLPTAGEAANQEEEIFRWYGHKRGINLTAKHTLYPPVKTCINPDCNTWRNNSLLKKEEQQHIVVFTHAQGAHPAWSIHLKCRVIFHVKDGTRSYYGGIPSYLQVAEHQFIQLELAMSWMDLMQIPSSLTMEEVWDSFTLLALLDDHHRSGIHLQVPHGGEQKDRFTHAMRECTERIITHRQEELPHACDGCLQVFEMPDGTLSRTEVVVTDDPTHKHLETICTVEGCDWPVTRDASIDAGNDLAIQDGDEWYEHDEHTGDTRLVQPAVTISTGVDDEEDRACEAKETQGKLKANFRRQWTNNEQLVVRPCGIINACSTMYHHEAVSNVLLLIKQIYSLPCARKPQHLIYDSNCNALHEVTSHQIKFFDGVSMCVDAFHHQTKHKASDTLCREHCNMKAYPELLDEDGGYYFNSSIAEQINVWFSAFHNICRKMTPVKYEFFLDEMIIRCNRVTLATLHTQGKRPYHPCT
ncbi:uncharacterized protein EDB91DRAFT_1087613 [Suillus paluster]|uniref:uncharacterized protein n=1 Tax=Suillus paluster TaxID=48578 RepID=UPI001B878F6E|nr:uncharacterized protein EDB91DRAFT_1087613 [Suillus paluster]KAG1724048.1 hypothetical protein EDB91DRAFT_1087613 [Suillus paluster]